MVTRACAMLVLVSCGFDFEATVKFDPRNVTLLYGGGQLDNPSRLEKHYASFADAVDSYGVDIVAVHGVESQHLLLKPGGCAGAFDDDSALVWEHDTIVVSWDASAAWTRGGTCSDGDREVGFSE